jgi:hypothetical protein
VRKIRGFQNGKTGLTIIILSGIFLSGISCTKEYSFEGTVPAGSVSIFTNQVPSGQTENDGVGGIELGLRFRSDIPGYVKGVRFYKTSGNSGTHTGQLYSFDGTLMASAVFVNETDSGWQTILFSSAIPIQANTTYIAACYSSLGNYISTHDGLDIAITNGPLTALADGADGTNGLYKYSATPAFPGTGFMSSNYWVDIVVSENQAK